MKGVLPNLLLFLVLAVNLPNLTKGQFRYGVLMYYDLCPWQYCGCPFCVEAPRPGPRTTIRPLTTSTIMERQEEEPTTTTTAPDDYYQDETTTTTMAPDTETTAFDTETIGTTEEMTTTTEMSETETPETETPETEAPDTEPPDTETEPPAPTQAPPRTRSTTPRRPSTSSSNTNNNNCPMCVCRTWSQRVHRWHNRFPGPSAPAFPRQRTTSCRFCGASWITSGAWSRKPGYLEQFDVEVQPINKWNRWGNRWDYPRYSDFGGSRFGRLNSVKAPERARRPLRSFNQFAFGNGFLFG